MRSDHNHNKSGVQSIHLELACSLMQSCLLRWPGVSGVCCCKFLFRIFLFRVPFTGIVTQTGNAITLGIALPRLSLDIIISRPRICSGQILSHSRNWRKDHYSHEGVGSLSVNSFLLFTHYFLIHLIKEKKETVSCSLII